MVEFFCVFFAFIFYFRFYADEPAACLPPVHPHAVGYADAGKEIIAYYCRYARVFAILRAGGEGSGVTRDIPPRVVACGVPCRVMRAVTPADRDRYPFHESIAEKYGK